MHAPDMKQILVFAYLFLGIHLSNAESIDDFLSSTLLGKTTDFLSETYRVEKSRLDETPPSYIGIGTIKYEGFDLEVNVFCRDGVCKAYGIWGSQSQIKDGNGKFTHEDPMPIYDAFTKLQGKLVKLYGEAPRLKIESACCSTEPGAKSQTYIWVNQAYALHLSFHDDGGSHSFTLTQHGRIEINGEFNATSDVEFFQKIYQESAGKLQEAWPVKIVSMSEETDSAAIPVEKNKALTESPAPYRYLIILSALVIFVMILCLIIRAFVKKS